MKIYSKFKDYYDHMQQYGQDPNCVFIRSEPKYLNLRTGKLGDKVYNNRYPDSGIKHILGFCGEIYPFVTQSLTSKDCFTAYNIKQYETFLDKYYENAYKDVKKLKIEYFNLPYNQLTKEHKRSVSGYESCYILGRKSVEEFFYEYPSKTRKIFDEIFIKFKIPLFIYSLYDPDLIIINPNLRNISFEKIMTPPECFSKIESYISGVLGNNARPIPEISNEDMIEAKGFDLKTSFRKQKKT